MLSRTILVLVFLVAAMAPKAAAQAAPAASATITAIHVQGSSHYNEQQLSAASGLKVGDVVTREQLQEGANQLSRLGVFERVNYSFSTVGEKLTLNFIVEEAKRVPVEFDNFPWFTREEMESAIRALAPLYDGTAPGDGAELQAMDAALLRLLTARGLPGEVEHRLVAQPAVNDLEMQFRVNGPALQLDSLDFGDALAMNSEPLRDRLRDVVKQTYSHYSLEVFENEQVRPLYLATGHLRAQFREPQVRLINEPGAVGKVAVKLSIDPGPAYKLAGVSWKGVTVIPEPELLTLLALHPGDVADGLKAIAGWQQVLGEYMHRGYLDAKLVPSAEFDDAAATVTYHVAVAEGPQYRMGEMVLTGISLGAETKLRAYWKLPKGAVFDRSYYDSMMEKLSKPSEEIFKDLPVHYTTLGQYLRTDPTTHVADVLLDFK